ncbi:MAG: CoA-binding protein [Bacteroidota bacterium]|jgi:predicted CoA-binding protein|nr:MAG: CoA-binding protein [Bacteroidota bacterium]
MSVKKTVVVGASPNRGRYAWIASEMLQEYGHPIVPLGIRSGEIAGESIIDIRTRPEIPDVDTVTLYLAPPNQQQWYDYLISLKPKRIIFNPGTENPEFVRRAREAGIETVEACTMVLLRSRQY